jgi:hypothetical protein
MRQLVRPVAAGSSAITAVHPVLCQPTLFIATMVLSCSRPGKGLKGGFA